MATAELLARLQPQGEYLTLRQVRQKMGYSLRQVETETGIARGTLSKVERGVELPKGHVFLALADLYGVPPERWTMQIQWITPLVELFDEAAA